MSITDELREWAKAFTHWWYDPVKDEYTYTTGIMPPSIDAIRLDSNIIAIADRIDAEHEKAMSRAGQLLADAEKDRDYNYANWQECKQKVLQGNITYDELNARIEFLEDELSHCIEMPKDADGEYIRIGDEVETTNFGTVEVEGFVHRAVAFYNYSEQPAYLCTTPANLCRHHHAPTVEDVLFEFAQFWCDEELTDVEHLQPDAAQTIAEYAAKLRLAEGEDA